MGQRAACAWPLCCCVSLCRRLTHALSHTCPLPLPFAAPQGYERLWMPMPSNTTNGYDSHVVCTMNYGYTYFIQIMFIVLCTIILFQARP